MRIDRHFEEVSITATQRWLDPDTGKKRQLTKKFFQTISPYNTNADGAEKTRGEIYNELLVQRSAWLREPRP